MVTRAVHLELAESLDADSFVNVLQSFINRRDKPNTLVPDCGSNFTGATRELYFGHPELNQDKIKNFTDQQSIKWKFNPPSSSHVGGAWEILVWVVKVSLLHLIKDRIFIDFQMMVVFAEVEKILINRPLTANSDNVKDFETLAPNQFLIGRNFCNNSRLNETRTNYLCSRKRERQVQLLTRPFWSRWYKEHFPTLARLLHCKIATMAD